MIQTHRAAVAVGNWLQQIDEWIWGAPLIVLLLACGIWLAVRLRGFPFRYMGRAFRMAFGKKGKSQSGEGEISAFSALCTALSTTIGTGNIVGVATAVCIGGPGALFWMVAAAFVGMATSFSECMLAVKYRSRDKDGHYSGGPFAYIEQGMGRRWRWLGRLFAVFGILAGLLGIGTIAQVNGVTTALTVFFDPAFEAADLSTGLSLLGTSYSWATVLGGLAVTICAALVIVGGLKRISGVATVMVPFMSAGYIGCCLLLLILHAGELPSAIVQIVRTAFVPESVAGGVAGSLFFVMQKGISRGVFSNEAGLGSAPIAAAAARTHEPVEQGLISMLGPFIDTVIICTMTGLCIVVTGAWDPALGLEGAAITAYAFTEGLPFPSAVSGLLLTVSLALFAFASILGWCYYAETCLQHLIGVRPRAVTVFRCLYIAAVAIGPYLSVSAVWNMADIFNGLMALPNLIALFALSGVVAQECRRYRRKHEILSPVPPSLPREPEESE